MPVSLVLDKRFHTPDKVSENVPSFARPSPVLRERPAVPVPSSRGEVAHEIGPHDTISAPKPLASRPALMCSCTFFRAAWKIAS